jgi:membrane-bound lytic murein transglycosylase MltF
MAAGTLLGNIILKRYLRNTEWLKKLTSDDRKKLIAELSGHFRKYGEQFEIDWLLLASLAFKESRFDQNAKGPTGAVGIMQIKPSTARSDIVGINDVSNIDGNVHAAAKYLRYLADTYFPGDDVSKLNRILFALASYNAGPNRIAGLRKKTQNPTIWFDNVEDTVSREIGSIPVRYVLNIYEYYIALRLAIEGDAQRREATEIYTGSN